MLRYSLMFKVRDCSPRLTDSFSIQNSADRLIRIACLLLVAGFGQGGSIGKVLELLNSGPRA